MRKIYLVPGIEMDSMLFKFFEFEGYESKVIKLISHDKDDNLSTYAKKISEQIDVKDPIFIGFSFGGILAVELGKLFPDSHIYVISSFKRRDEISPLLKFLGNIRILKFFPEKILRTSNFIRNFLLGVKKNNQEKLDLIYKDIPDGFLSWALDNCLRWTNQTVPSNTVHLHGEKDNIVPIKYIDDCIMISGAGHLMFSYQARKIRKILQNDYLG